MDLNTNVNANINQDSFTSIQGPASTPDTATTPNKSPSPVNSGLSSIEQSQAVLPIISPPSMEVPSLAAPNNNDQYLVFLVSAMDGTNKPFVQLLMSEQLNQNDVKQQILDGWSKNLREIAEHVRQLLASPMYQQLQEIQMKGGDSQQQSVSGISSAGAPAPHSANFLSQTQAVDYVPGTSKTEKTAEANNTKPTEAVVPIVASFLVGGGLALGITQVTAIGPGALPSPLVNSVHLIEQVSPLFTSVTAQEAIPLINLMVMAPIYFNAWNEAVSRLNSGERNNDVQTVHTFASDVIKMLSDPTFIPSLIASRTNVANPLTSNAASLTNLSQVILAGVALGLLYSVEVGKVQNAQFGGMQPQELQYLLINGTALPNPANPNLTTQQRLTNQLIAMLHSYLQPLSVLDRTEAVNQLLAYLGDTHDLKEMLSPGKVFDEVLSNSTANFQANNLDKLPA